jgi:hypothetical protein
MAGDLVSSKYALQNPLLALVGGLVNAVNPVVPARSNAEWSVGNMTDGALAGTGVLAFVPVPVDVGSTVSKVSFVVGNTAAATPTHQFAAVYAGTGTAPALLAQSADATTMAIAAQSGIVTYTLATPQVITTTNAPNGFIYAGISITAGTVCTALSVGTPTGINYQWQVASATSPLFLAGTAGSALAGTAAATIASASAKAVAPVLFLT